MSFALAEIELPVRLRPERTMSDIEFMRFCAANEPMRFERDATGEILVMSPTGTEGGGLELEVAAELRDWARRDGGGRSFGSNAGFRLPDGSVRAADAAWVSRGRWEALSREQREGFAPICPEFVIEVRSKADRAAELQAKMEMWMANGAIVAWQIDPAERVVTINRAGHDVERLAEPTSVQGNVPVAEFELVMAGIWGEGSAGRD